MRNGCHQSLIQQTTLSMGDTQCFKGGVKIESGIDTNSDNSLQLAEVTQTTYQCDKSSPNMAMNFNRIATIPACMQVNATCNTNDETAAEIVAASTDGMTLIYTDSLQDQIGFVNIANPNMPKASGVLAMGGEPTSVAVKGAYAVVAVNTSADYIKVSGKLAVVDIATKTLVHSVDLGGQPDSIAVVTLQENNHLVLVDLVNVDLTDDRPAVIKTDEVRTHGCVNQTV